MEFIRIGEKVVSRERISKLIGEILHQRSRGATQQEVALNLGVERSFVSRLEGLGEVRRGERVALVGFPIENKEMVEEIARGCGVDFTFLLSEEERLNFVGRENGAELFNEVLEILAKLRDYDLVVLLVSDKRISVIEKILDGRVLGIPIGRSPIREDKYVDPDELRSILSTVVTEKRGGKWRERGRKYKSWLLKKRP